MRALVISALVLSSGGLRLCGSESPPPPPAAAPPGVVGVAPAAPPAPVAAPPAPAAAVAAVPGIAPVTPVATTARLGGTVVAVGDQSVELIPSSDGQVVGYLNDPTGQPVVAGGATLQARLTGMSVPLTLAWEENTLRYTAQVPAGTQLQPGPVDVTLTVAGQTKTGHADLVPVVSAPEHGGVVLAVGQHSAEVLAQTDGSVVAFLNGPQGVIIDPQIQIVAQVAVTGGTTRDVALTFDPTRSCWRGQVSDAQLATGPVQLQVTSGGQTSAGNFMALAVLPQPEHGGTIVAAGGFGVEVVPAADGQVEAFVKDPTGASVPETDGYEVTVGFDVDGRRVPIVMAWDASRQRFVGRHSGRIRLESGPLDVQVVSSRRHLHGRGRLVRLAVAGRAPVVVGVQPPPPAVGVRIQAPPPPVVGVTIRHPSPPAVGVRVQTPGVSVGVRGPGVTVGVGVRPPPPPAAGVGVRVQTPGVSVGVGVRPPPPPAAGVGVKVQAPPPPRRRAGAGIDISAGGGIRIGN